MFSSAGEPQQLQCGSAGQSCLMVHLDSAGGDVADALLRPDHQLHRDGPPGLRHTVNIKPSID